MPCGRSKYAVAAHARHEGRSTGRSAAPPVTCRPAPIWSSIHGTITVCVGLRPDLSGACTPNACNNCHTDKSAEWAAAAIESWHGPNREGFQNYAEAFHAAWSDQPDAATLLAAVAADANAPAFARASALTDLAPNLTRQQQRRADRPVGPRSDGADRRARYARKRRGCSDLAACRTASLRFRAAASASELSRFLPPFQPRTSLPPTANGLSARRRSSSTLSASMPIGRKRARRSEVSLQNAAVPRMPRPNTKLRGG